MTGTNAMGMIDLFRTCLSIDAEFVYFTVFVKWLFLLPPLK